MEIQLFTKNKLLRKFWYIPKNILIKTFFATVLSELL